MCCISRMSVKTLICCIYSVVYLVNADSQISQSLGRYERMTSDMNRKCRIPQYPQNTKYVVLGETETDFKVGDYVAHQNMLQTLCDDGYKVKPSISLCINGTWVDSLSRCLPACPPLASTNSTNVTCSFNNIDLSDCYDPVEGTTAKLVCNPLYEEGSIQQYPVRDCINGKWEPAIIDCRPICGLKRPLGRPLIVNGTVAKRGDYPWQVGIYNAKTMELLCGGSIIDQRIILTAAHCVCDYNGHAFPQQDFLIAAGKYYRRYNDNRDIDVAQYSKILSIYIPENFKSMEGFMANDIAILILESPFKITLGVQPVCIELYGHSENLDLSQNWNCTVVGWGYTRPGRALAEELKEIIVPYIPYQTCYENVPKLFRQFITSDKICAGYSNSSMAVCGGDSGGGLHLQNSLTDRYFVLGVVSNSPQTLEATCDSNQYSTYTSVNKHRNYLQRIIAFHKLYQSVECVDGDCSITEGKPRICTDEIRENCRNVTTCKIPEYPRHAKLELLDNWASVSSATPGGDAQVDNKLKTICMDDYHLKADLNVEYDLPICTDSGNWTSKPVLCVKCRFPLHNDRHWAILMLLSRSAINIKSSPVGQLVANTLANLKTCSDK